MNKEAIIARLEARLEQEIHTTERKLIVSMLNLLKS